MKIKKVDGMQGEIVISLDREELRKLCNGLYLLSKYRDIDYDKEMHTQMRVVKDIIDYGAVDNFTFATAVEGNDTK